MFQSTDKQFVPPDNLFVLNPGNRNFIYGKSRRLAGSGTWLVIIVIGLMLAVLAYVGGHSALIAFEVNQSGHSGSGLIVNRRISSGKSTSYYLTFKYTPTTGDSQGKSFSVEQQVTRDTYNRLTNGSEVNISYVPTDPGVALLAGSDADNWDINTSIIVGIVGVVILTALLLALLRDWRRNARLAHEGQLVQGQLTSYRTRRGSKGGFFVDVTCSFESPANGQYLTASGSAARRDLRGKPAQPSGTPVAVLYVDNTLFKVL